GLRSRGQREGGDREGHGDRQQGRSVQAPAQHAAEDSSRAAATPAQRRRARQIVCARVLQHVAVARKSLSDSTHICARELIAEIRELAEPLKDTRVVHISATAFGGGVSEILYALVPLMRDVGLDCEWQGVYCRGGVCHPAQLTPNAPQRA